MAKFCSECGAALTGSGRFCPECGTATGNASNEAGSRANVAPAPAPVEAVTDPDDEVWRKADDPDMRVELADDPSTPPDVLRQLAADPDMDMEVLSSVAENPSTPA